jgi:apolipoprotein N-acyltransferase
MTTLSFLTPSPKLSPNITLVIDPFDYMIWICIIVAFLLMFFNLFLMSQHWKKFEKLSINWALIASFVGQQLSFCLPSVGSLRILFIGWLMACLVLRTSYSGCLHSLMAFPSRIKTIDTIEELAIAQKYGEIQTITGFALFFQSLKV